MKAKAARTAHGKRFTEDGLPRDANEWTEADWKALHDAIEGCKEKVSKNHELPARDQP